jgi:iron(III) transport system substrate-binding protein
VRLSRRSFVAALAAQGFWLAGCRNSGPAAAGAVTIYTSVDEPVATPILRDFEAASGISVRIVTDTEATKSAGLAARALAEKANPQADVWWGNEVFHTINLARSGVLAAYASPAAADLPPRFKQPDGLWAGTCLRARVIGVYGDVAKSSPGWAKSVFTLNDPALKGRVGIARPTAGTTGGHVAAIYALLGKERADDYFRSLHANGLLVLGGNSQVAKQVGSGVLLAGLTDNDDVEAVARTGGSIEMVLPDQQPDGVGTLTIPCTVGLIAGAKNPEPAKRLIDHLLSPAVETKLIEAKFGRYSVRSTDHQAVRTMDVSYEKIADALPWAATRALAILEGRPAD